MADVNIDVGLTYEDIAKAAKQIREQIQAIFKATEGKHTTVGFDKFANNLRELYINMDKLLARGYELEQMKIMPDGYDEAVAKLRAEQIKYAEAVGKSQEYVARLAKEEQKLASIKNAYRDNNYKDWQQQVANLAEQYAQTEAKIESLNKSLKQAEINVKRFATAGNESAQKKWSGIASGLKEELKSAQAELVKLENAAKGPAEKMQEAFSKNQQAIKQTEKNIDEFSNAISKSADQVGEIQNQINNVRSEIEGLKSQIKTGEDTDEYAEIFNKLEKYINNATFALRQFYQTGAPQEGITGWKSLINIINQGPRAVENIADKMVSTLPPAVQVVYAAVKFGAKQIISAYQSAFKEVSTVIKSNLVKAAKAATSAMKELAKAIASIAGNAFLSPVTKLAETIRNLGKGANSSTPSLKQMFNMFLKYGIGVRSLYFLIRKLRTALFDGFADLANAFAPFNEAMSSLKTSLYGLRNAFASAFAPIIQAVAPILVSFINMIAEAVTKIGMLIALLTGQKTYARALPVAQNYADATGKTASNADKAAKATKKQNKETKALQRTIAGFDDVEILKAPDDDSGSGGSGGGGGGGGGGGITGGGFVTEQLPLANAMVDMLKNIWETADAYDLGVMFGKKLGDLLRTFNEYAPKIEEVTTRIAKIIASFLAGFLSVNDTFKVLGQAIANVINIVFATLDAFLKTFMSYDGFKNLGLDIYYTLVNALHNIEWATIFDVFANLGTGIAQTLNEVLAKPDTWSETFIALTNALRSLLLRAYYFVTTLKWGDIGLALAQGINDGIANFPFSLVASTAASFINGIFDFLRNTAENTNWTELGQNIGKMIMDFFDQTNWSENGKSLATFLQGIFDTLKGIVDTLDFGKISSYIINFITNFIDNFKWEENADTILTFLNGLLEILNNTLEGIGWGEIISNIWNYIQTSGILGKTLDNVWKLISTIAMTKLNGALSKFFVIGTMVIRGILTGIAGAIAGIPGWIKTNIIDKFIAYIKEKFGINSPAKTTEFIGSGIIEGILKGILDFITGIPSWIVTNVFTPFKNGLLSAFGINGDSADNVKDTGSGIIQGIWNGITETLSDPIGWIQEHIGNPIKGGLETAFGIAGGVASKLKDIGSAVINGFKSGAEEQAPQVDVSATQVNTQMQNALKSGDWNAIGADVINKFKAGIDAAKAAITATAQTIQNGLKKALSSGDWKKIGANVITLLKNGMSKASATLKAAAQNIQKTIYKYLSTGDWKKIGTELITLMKKGMDATKSAITNSAKTIQKTVYKTLATADWKKIGSNAITLMKNGMASIKGSITTTASTIRKAVYVALETADWKKIGSTAINKVKSGISGAKASIVSTAKNVKNSVYNALESGHWSDIGRYIIKGIGRGIDSGWGWLKSKVRDLARSLYDAARAALNISSPSKVFRDKIGAMIPAGIGVGIEDNEDIATSSVKNMADNLVKAAKNISLPPIAMGNVIPNNVANNYDTTQTTLQNMLDLLQSLQNEFVTKDDLQEALENAMRNFPVNFYMGDEQVARHANAGNRVLNRRFSTTAQ